MNGCKITPRPHKKKGIEFVAEGSNCREEVDKLFKYSGKITEKYVRSKIIYIDTKPQKKGNIKALRGNL
jgi:hypothetical protein